MANLAMSRVIKAPVDRVFHAFSDFENCAGRIRGIKKIEMLTAGPVGKGTSFKETRTMFGRDATETMTVCEYVPNQAVALEANSCGAYFKSSFRFTPQGDATKVDFAMETKALSLFAKIMKPIAFLMMGTMKKCVQGDMDDLAAYCEGEPVPAA